MGYTRTRVVYSCTRREAARRTPDRRRAPGTRPPERVPGPEAGRRGGRPRRGEIDEKGGREDGGPDPEAQQQECREGDPRRGPDGGSADVHEREPEPELARDEVDGGEGDEEPHILQDRRRGRPDQARPGRSAGSRCRLG